MAIHEFRNFTQVEAVRSEIVAKEVSSLKSEMRDLAKELTAVKTELVIIQKH